MSDFPMGAIRLLVESLIQECITTGQTQTLVSISDDMPSGHMAVLHFEFLKRATEAVIRPQCVIYKVPSMWCVSVEINRS